MNCSPKVLLSKHTMVVFNKVRNNQQTLTDLRDSLLNPEVNSVFESAPEGVNTCFPTES